MLLNPVSMKTGDDQLLLAGLLAACATAPVARQFERRATVPAEFAAVWDAVIDIFGERSWAIDNMDRESGIITTDWMLTGQLADSYMDCGSAPLATDREHMTRFNIVVREAASGSYITVNTAHRVKRYLLGDPPAGVINCVSTGVLESEIHEEVTRRTSGN